MNMTTLKKGFIITIPLEIQREVGLKEGEKLVVESIGGDTIILERPAENKTFRKCRGMWADQPETKNAVKYVRKIRKESDRLG